MITAPEMKGANQPYHFAKGQSLSAAERYLAECAAASEQLALKVLRETVEQTERRGKVIARCAILLAAGRNLPALPNILASHPLIHTAEGEFFRQSFRRAGELLGMEVTGIRERDLESAPAGHSARRRIRWSERLQAWETRSGRLGPATRRTLVSPPCWFWIVAHALLRPDNSAIPLSSWPASRPCCPAPPRRTQ